MKSLALFALLATSALHADPASIHGMVIFGHDPVYVSHLPMFHSPHDYQAIMEVELDAKAAAIYENETAAHPDELFTILPEAMVLPDVVKNRTPFKATLFRGHFERGGVPVAENVKVTIKDVVHFHKFDPNAVRPEKLTYISFGFKETWLVHLITSRPDFDQIAHMPITMRPGTPFTFPGVDNTKPLPGLKSIYLEFGDLE